MRTVMVNRVLDVYSGVAVHMLEPLGALSGRMAPMRAIVVKLHLHGAIFRKVQQTNQVPTLATSRHSRGVCAHQ